MSKEDKRHLLAHLIQEGNWHQVLVFTRTKHGANRLAQQLEARGITTAAIHGNKSQGARVRRCRTSRPTRSRRWSLPRSLRAASTSRSCRTSSTTSCRTSRRTTSIASGARRAPAAPGVRCRSSQPDEAPLLKDIERLLGKSVPVAADAVVHCSADAAPYERRAGRAGRWAGFAARWGPGRATSRARAADRRSGAGAGLTAARGWRHAVAARAAGLTRSGAAQRRGTGSKTRVGAVRQAQRHHDSRSGGAAPGHQTGSRPTGTQQGHHRSDASRPQRRRDRQPEGQGGGRRRVLASRLTCSQSNGVHSIRRVGSAACFCADSSSRSF